MTQTQQQEDLAFAVKVETSEYGIDQTKLVVKGPIELRDRFIDAVAQELNKARPIFSELKREDGYISPISKLKSKTEKWECRGDTFDRESISNEALSKAIEAACVRFSQQIKGNTVWLEKPQKKSPYKNDPRVYHVELTL